MALGEEYDLESHTSTFVVLPLVCETPPCNIDLVLYVKLISHNAGSKLLLSNFLSFHLMSPQQAKVFSSSGCSSPSLLYLCIIIFMNLDIECNLIFHDE